MDIGAPADKTSAPGSIWSMNGQSVARPPVTAIAPVAMYRKSRRLTEGLAVVSAIGSLGGGYISSKMGTQRLIDRHSIAAGPQLHIGGIAEAGIIGDGLAVAGRTRQWPTPSATAGPGSSRTANPPRTVLRFAEFTASSARERTTARISPAAARLSAFAATRRGQSAWPC